MDRKNLLTINQFAEVCRTTPRTVRFYEQKGLIKPVYVDPFTKYRYYEKEEQARDFLRLRLLQNFHVPLREIQAIVRKGRLEESLDTELHKLKDEIREREKEYIFLRRVKRFLFEEQDLGKLLKTEDIGPFTLLCRKFPRVEYEKTYLYCQEVQKDAKKLGIRVKDTYIMYYETRYYRPKQSFVEIWLICKREDERKKTIPSEYFFRRFPKTKVISYTYKGPFTYFMLLYKKLNDYVDPKRLTKSQVSFDYYVKYQVNSKSQYDYLTKICFPVQNTELR